MYKVEAVVYRKMAQLEDVHWWFSGRRYIVNSIIKRLTKLPVGAKILDAGCGTGGNLKLLQGFGIVTGMEMDERAAAVARKKAIVPVVQGKIPEDLPFEADSFDLILLLDVLEHIDNDIEALKSLSRLLKPGGYLIITVPAYPFLWSNHDVIHHHKRRYKKTDLLKKLIRSGFELKYASYYNTLLFPLIALARIMKVRFNLDAKNADLKPTPILINYLLKSVFRLESYLIGKIKFPFGVSAIVCSQKAQDWKRG